MINKALLTVEDVKNFIMEAISLNNEIRYLSRKQLAEYLDVPPYYITKFIKMGMPWIGTKTRKNFKVADVTKWLRENNIDIDYEKAISNKIL